MILARSVFVVILFTGMQSCGSSDPVNGHNAHAVSIHAAEGAYFQFNLHGAEKLFAQVLNNPDASLGDRLKAGQALMNIEWHIYENIEGAEEMLSQLQSLEYELSSSLSQFSQIQRKAGKFEEAMSTAGGALLHAETAPERDDANLAYAQAALDQEKLKIFSGASEQVNNEKVAQALALARGVLETQQGLAAPSLVALEAALILDRGQDALQAWRSFFHIRSSSPVTSVLKQPQENLLRLLAVEKIDGEENDYHQLVLSLQESRQFDAAALVALVHLSDDARADDEITQLLAYREYLDEITKISHTYYRKSAIGPAEDVAFELALENAAESVQQHFILDDDSQKGFFRDEFLADISVRFGAEVSFKRLSGYYGFHFGHRVVDEKYSIKQYSKATELRFISLDSMVSNGFTSWFWNGRAQVGGWAENPIIIQVRSAYSDGGIRAWKGVSDEKTRNRIVAEIAQHRVSDSEIARKNPFAYLPGLAQRMRQTAYKSLLNKLAQKGLSGSALQLAFIAEVERINLESSIIAHEGRHAIESESLINLFRFPSQKEYLAKLSEVAFSSAPKLAICGGILSANIGDDSSHGTANQKIMEGLVEWMNANQNQVAELDGDQPLLPQLDLLTDEQLRDAFRSMDYLADS